MIRFKDDFSDTARLSHSYNATTAKRLAQRAATPTQLSKKVDIVGAAMELLGDDPKGAGLATFKQQKAMNLREAIVVQVAHLIRGTRSLFTNPNQFKLYKGQDSEGFATIGFNLSPSKEAFRFTGRDMCLFASLGCIASCLKLSGHNALTMATIARIARTILWVKKPTTFLHWAGVEIARHKRWADNKGLRLAIRPNLLSDDTELAGRIKAMVGAEIPVYDYTAVLSAMTCGDGVHRTFSRKEGRDLETLTALRHDKPVAVVFAGDLPMEWNGYPVIDGDVHDLRFKDSHGAVVVGLKVKGVKTETRQRAIDSGFAVSV